MNVHRLRNRVFALFFSRFPGLTSRWVKQQQLQDYGLPPWTPLRKPLSACTVAVVTTAGVHLRTDNPFDMNDEDGDASFRVIAHDTAFDQLRITHDYYDHRDADRDVNIVLPLTRLHELADEQVIGGVAPFHYSFMGHIDGQHMTRLLVETAPEVARRLKQEQVDAVVLTPAWGLCNRSVGLVAREIERQGIPTVAVSLQRELSEKTRPPRTVFVRWPFGHPLGEPFRAAQQRWILLDALQALVDIQIRGTIVDLPYLWRRPGPWEDEQQLRMKSEKLRAKGK